MSHAFVVAFRDRGIDPLRRANLDYVLTYIRTLDMGPVHLVDDGYTGTDQFNRHKAYNTGAHQAFTHADVVTFYEADMILPKHQLTQAITAALEQPRLVVPFTARHELSPTTSACIRAGADYSLFKGHVVKPKPRRTGAINTISAKAYTMVGGYDETFSGSHWDDRSMHLAFDKTTNPTHWINGAAWHLYHLPGYEGAHLTTEDRQATQANRQRFHQYRQAKTPQAIRQLTTAHA